MGSKQIVAVLQVGGEFKTDDDGQMSYSGGEAHAMHVKSDWTFKTFKHEISSTLNNLKLDSYVFKYFLPRNNKTLISISNDKDLKRMVEFHAESETTYIYVMKKADNRYPSDWHKHLHKWISKNDMRHFFQGKNICRGACCFCRSCCSSNYSRWI
jgi:zinc finger SWIM domain-containing protein 3